MNQELLDKIRLLIDEQKALDEAVDFIKIHTAKYPKGVSEEEFQDKTSEGYQSYLKWQSANRTRIYSKVTKYRWEILTMLCQEFGEYVPKYVSGFDYD